MRPRVFPAEDSKLALRGSPISIRFNEAAGIPRGRRERAARPGRGLDASMRPRVFPAEDVPLEGVARAMDDASMRPRVFPAEDASSQARPSRHCVASMRPRVFPAEDVGEETYESMVQMLQ